MLGNIPLKEFQRKDLHRYIAQRKKQVQPATVNRAIAAISKLFSYALECGEVDTHPLIRFPKLKEPKKVFRPLTVQQFRDLVEAVDNPYLQAMVAVIGETGIRKGEKHCRSPGYGWIWVRRTIVGGIHQERRDEGDSRCRSTPPDIWPGWFAT